ncbi:MAG: hypothetical protein JWQ21_3008 [Herminiimonas sp.]|nr:hypothetical protein [Herminiimonas sp.]
MLSNRAISVGKNTNRLAAGLDIRFHGSIRFAFVYDNKWPHYPIRIRPFALTIARNQKHLQRACC